jgi:hypothetical protein
MTIWCSYETYSRDVIGMQFRSMWAKGSLGLLHTQAKSHDHDIGTALKDCPKVVPRHFQNHVVW